MMSDATAAPSDQQGRRAGPPPEHPKKQMAAGALFFNRSGELLIVKPTYRDDWSVPGGVVEADESPREACRREVREELGLEVEPGPLLAVDYTTPRTAWGQESLQFLFAGSVLEAHEIERIVLPPAELSAFRFASVPAAMAALNPRLALRVRHALVALDAGTTAYLENGVPPASPGAGDL